MSAVSSISYNVLAFCLNCCEIVVLMQGHKEKILILSVTEAQCA